MRNGTFDLAKGETSGLSFKLSEGLYKACFSPQDWHLIKRNALMAAGWVFVTKFLPKRFQWFAVERLGYPLHHKANRGLIAKVFLPLVNVGTLRDRMLAGAFPQASAKGTELFIRTPMAHPLRPEYAAVLHRITPDELAEMNKVIVSQIKADILGTVSIAKSAKTAGRLGLTPPAKAAIRAGLSERFGASAGLTNRRRAA